MDLEFQTIEDARQTTKVSISEQVVGTGAQGSVYQASIEGNDRYCVKVLTGVAAGEVRNEVAMFQRLRSRTKAQLANPGIQGALRENAEALHRYLPDLVAFGRLPGYARAEFLLARSYCPGTPLHELLQDPDYGNRDAFWRISVARKICRLMVAMELFGFAHLDAYPDNILVENPDDLKSLRVAMIDLEGVGVLAPNISSDPARNRWRDEFERPPRSFSKDDFWGLPWWFPVPGKTRALSDWFIHAARYQMLSLVTLTLTWGSTPGCWLEREAHHELQTYAEQLRSAGRVPTDLDREVMASCLDSSRIDTEVLHEFTERCGNAQLAGQLMSWFTAAFLGPQGKNWPWFTALALQNALNEARV